MGRWVYFNTGVEYKFAFATQSSADITLFGGQDDGEDEAHGYYFWSWSACCDEERCLRNIRRMERDNGWGALDFDQWDKNEEGSMKLRNEIYDLITGNEETRFRYILGCLIYHQLLWCRELSCHYEA
jgi:hypothetical protein